MTRFDLDNFTRSADIVADTALPDELFGFISRQVAVPPGCVALVEPVAGQPYIVPGGGVLGADGMREVTIVRLGPYEFEYAFADFHSSDGFPFTGAVELTVAVVPDRTELLSFKRALLGSAAGGIRVDRLRRHCEDAVQSAVARFTGATPAERLVRPDTWQEFDAIMLDAFKPVGFASGLTVDRDPRLTLKSTAFEESRSAAKAAEIRRQREEEEDRRRRAHAASRQEQLASLGEALAKVRDMATASGVVDVGDIIRAFDSDERGALYQGLLALDKPLAATQYILAVAGSALLWFDPAAPGEIARKLKLPKDDIGALRSVRVVSVQGAPRILVGARNGVHVLDADGAAQRTCILRGRSELRGGFNAAAIVGGDVFATHSEVGLMRWRPDAPEAAIACLEHLTDGCHSVRDVQCDDMNRLWFSVDNLLVTWNPKQDDSERAVAAPAEITALTAADGYAVAGLKNGSIVRWHMDDLKTIETIRAPTGAPVRSVAWLRGGGVPRLLIGDGRTYLDLMVLGDPYHAQYRCMHEMRWGFAAEDIVVGVNDSRDTFIVWHKNRPEEATAAVPVRRLTGRSIQDVALL